MKTEDLIRIAHTVPGVVCGDQHGQQCVRVRDALLEVSQAEVERAATFALEMRQRSAQQNAKAVAANNTPEAAITYSICNAMNTLALLIRLPPDGCTHCLNTREVESTVAPGQSVRCPTCAERVVA